ncbi:MAG: holo-ACP synthase [Bacteroidota bacterium]
MIYGIGTDIIEVERVGGLVNKGGSFSEKVFSPGEIAYCESKRHKNQHYAARFAAKEAFMKAIGTGWRLGITFHDIEVIHDELGKPNFLLHGKALDFANEHHIANMHLTISHIKEYATATVVLET